MAIPKIKAGDSPITQKEWQKKKLQYAGGYQGYIEDLRKATDVEAGKRAGAAPVEKTSSQKFAEAVDASVAQGNKAIAESSGNVAYGKFPETQPITTEEMAQSRIREDTKAQQETEESLYGESLSLSPEEEAKRLFDIGEEKKTQLQKQIEQMNKLDREKFKESEKQGQSAIAGVTAQYSPGREDVVSTTNPLISQEFGTRVKQGIEQSRTRLDLLQQQRASQYEQLEEATRSNNINRAENLRKNLASVENQILKEQTDLSNSQAKNTKEAFNYLEAIGTDALAEMDTATVSQMFTDLGLPSYVGLAMQSAAKKSAVAEASGDALKIAQAKATLAKTLAETQYAGLTTEQRNFIFAQGLEGAAKDQYLNFAGKNPTYGFTKIGNKIYATNPLTGAVKQVAGTTGGGEKLTPTGTLQTTSINGKNVTLDSAALFSLQAANGSAKDAGVGEINITSSTRDQKQTILQMAAKWGVEVEPSSLDSVNKAAATLTAMGHTVAAVGNSNHEHGLAIDIYPSDPASQNHAGAKDYIDKVKPYLELKGWRQSTDPNDKGHFNYVGMTVYTPEQKAVMNGIDITKYTSTAATALGDAGLSYSDLATFKQTAGLTPEQKAQAENVKMKTEIALENINKIFNKELWRGAGRTGMIFGKWSLTTADLQAALDNITSNIALDEMKALKEASKTGSTGFGAMNEKELTLLTSSKGTIIVDMSEEALKENLESIKKILLKANQISNDPTSTQVKREVKKITDQAKINEVYGTLKKLQLEGVSEEEMKAKLEEQGIDSTQFFN